MGADSGDARSTVVARFRGRFESANAWDQRVGVVRSVSEEVGRQDARAVYSSLAEEFYVPTLTPTHAHTFWREEYTLAAFQRSYTLAHQHTSGFNNTDETTLIAVLRNHPASLLTFRTIVGYTPSELAATSQEVADADGLTRPTQSTINSMEAGDHTRRNATPALARTIDRLVRRTLYTDLAGGMRVKQAKPDTEDGWESVRRFAREGVPFAVFLHQRRYGGAFRTLLDATSGQRGDALEEPVSAVLSEHGVPHVRPNNQDTVNWVRNELNIRVRPEPDVVIHNANATAAVAILECKAANDGGTARDKAARFQTLAQEADRLRIALFGVLSGYGWRRTTDALGPVIEACEGRVFTPQTLPEIVGVHPVSDWVSTATT